MVGTYIYNGWRQNSNIKLLDSTMNKKICFSSVLKQKRSSQNIVNKPLQKTLGDMVEEYLSYPNGDFTLRYYSNNSLKACNSKQDFDERHNALDKWIHSKQNQINKENNSNTQSQKIIPNELLKYANGAKSPRRLSQVKADFNQNTHKNADMKQICRQYVENAKNGRDMGKNGPVWRFSAINEDQENDDKVLNEQKRNSYNQNEQFRQSTEQENFKIGRRFQQKQNSSVGEIEKVNNSKNTPQPAPKGQNLMKIVEQIKNNIVPQIQVMAERIVQQKISGEEEDQELLISQRESEVQRGQKKIQQEVQKEIGQYLTRKNTSSDSRNLQTASVGVRKSEEQSFDKPPSKSSNQHVGYSFSSEFQNPSLPQHSSRNNDSLQKQEIREQPLIKKLSKQNRSFLDPCNKISLPNIDEVKSERDGMEKVEEYFGEPVQSSSKPPIQSSIDKNFIKQIQSVAYVSPADQVEIFTNKPRPDQMTKDRQGFTEYKNGGQRKSSLLQQISKTAMSIEGLQENNSVNVSVAEKESPVKQESIKRTEEDKIAPVTTPVEVSGFVAPAPVVRIQFKKVPSPERTQKQQQKTTSIRPVQANQLPQVQVPLVMPPSVTANYSSGNYSITGPKTSFGNILQESQKQVIVTNAMNQQASYNNFSQVQALSNYQQQYQNSRERGNSLKNSNQEDQGRKLKITISPKYHGKQDDKYEGVANVADFKLNNVKMEDSTDPLKHPQTTQPLSKVSISTNPSSMVPAKQSMGGDKFRLDSMFTNVRNVGNMVVTETREIHQESRDKPQEHALIRVQKYERVQKMVQPAKNTKQSISQRNNASIKSSQQFQFDLDF